LFVKNINFKSLVYDSSRIIYFYFLLIESYPTLTQVGPIGLVS